MAESVNSADLLVVGSGPVGATVARVVNARRPDLRILMVEAGPVLTDPPGLNLKNLDDENLLRRARELSQGPPAAPGGEVDVPMIEGTVTARQGTHLAEPGGTGMPAAAMSTCVGGMGAHWTCAAPRPNDSERIPFIRADELDAALAEAERVLAVTELAFAESAQGAAIRARLAPEFPTVRVLPVAARVLDGKVRWTGVDTILEPVLGSARFELRAETLCRQVLVDGRRATGAVLEDRRTGEQSTVAARAVVIAADALRTPQLLWASGIRPPALGRYLTEHPFAMAVVALDPAVVPPLAETREQRLDPVMAVLNVPYAEPDHPFHAQIMHVERPPFPLPGLEDVEAPSGFAVMGWGFRKWPRPEDRVEFSGDRTDAFGMPAPAIRYELTEREHAERERALANVRRAGEALGTFAAEPRVMPNGSSLHYMGTVRMGASDDSTTVCDPHARVWGFDNLFVGGNGVIPTANCCNPTLTSVALAVRSCDGLLAQLR